VDAEQVTNGSPEAGRRRRRVEGGRLPGHRVRVTAEEEARLQLLAGRAGVSVPKLLVDSALSSTAGRTPGERDRVIGEMLQMRRLLSASSVNLNQLAKVANGTGEVPAESAAAIRAMRQTVARLDSLIDEWSGA